MLGVGALAAACNCDNCDNKRSLSSASVCLLKRGGWLGRGLIIEAGPKNQGHKSDLTSVIISHHHIPGVVPLSRWLDLGILEPGAGVNIGLGVT